MVQNQNAPGTRSEHAGAKTNTIGTNDTTNVGFTSVPSKQKSTQKGVAPEKHAKNIARNKRNKHYIER